MRYMKLFEEFNKKIIGYHVTSESNIKNIKKEGLIPKTPEDFGEKGDIEGVYLFKTKEDMENALSSWLGERIDDWEDEHDKPYNEMCLIVDLSGLDSGGELNWGYLIDSVEYEWTCTTTISPDRILKIEKLY